jgi:hypothetical protein
MVNCQILVDNSSNSQLSPVPTFVTGTLLPLSSIVTPSKRVKFSLITPINSVCFNRIDGNDRGVGTRICSMESANRRQRPFNGHFFLQAKLAHPQPGRPSYPGRNRFFGPSPMN